jgi:hypothetical protein
VPRGEKHKLFQGKIPLYSQPTPLAFPAQQHPPPHFTVSVFKPDGTELEFIEIPEPLCTSLCFGDDDLKTLFIVSGLEGTSSEKAGSVYRTRIEVAGTPVSDASTSLRKLTN